MSRIVDFRLLVTAFVVLGWSVAAAAQSVQTPDSLQQRRIEEDQRARELQERLQRREQDGEAVSGNSIEPQFLPEGDADERFLLVDVQFSTSEILTLTELQAVASRYLNKQTNFADLNQLLADINTLYKGKGVVTAQAILPPQEVVGGLIKVQLVEGRFGTATVSGNASTRAEFVQERVGQTENTLFDLSVWSSAINRLNQTTDLYVTAQLEAGEEFGTTDVDLLVSEPDRRSLTLVADNRGSRSTGIYHAGLTYRDASLTGRRDPLALSGGAAEGSTELSAYYSRPVNTQGGQLNLAAFYSDIEIVDGPTSDLDITGESKTFQGEFVQPLLVDNTWKIVALAGGKWRSSDTDIASLRLSATDYRAYFVGASIERYDQSGVWYSDQRLTYATKTVDAGNNELIYRGSLARIQRVIESISLYVNLVGQYADADFVASGEQFQIGGATTVRGYDEGLLLGTRGYYANVDLISNIDSISTDALQWQTYAFFDLGRVASIDLLSGAEDTLSGAGLGMRLVTDFGFAADIAVAAPLRDTAVYDKDLKLHVRVSYNFL